MRQSLTLQRLITLLGAPLIWMAHFLACYVIVALVCALQLTDVYLLGLDPAQLGITIVTVLALLLMGGIAIVNWRKWTHPSGPDPEMSCFFAANTLLLCMLSALALIWVAFPAVLLPTCSS